MENQRANDNDRCVLAAHPGKVAGAATETARARSSSSKTACPTTFSVKAPVPVDRPYGRARTATLNYAVSCPEAEQRATRSTRDLLAAPSHGCGRLRPY